MIYLTTDNVLTRGGGKGFGKCERKEERNERIGGGENRGGERIRKEETDEDK